MIEIRTSAIPADMLARLVGLGVDYTGDMANPSGRGAIVAVHESWGQTADITLEDGRRIQRFQVAGMGTPATRNGCAKRIIVTGPMHGAPYLAQLETAAILRTQNDKAGAQVARANFEAREAARVITDAPLFFWNGIKDARGEKLQPCHYSDGELINSPAGTLLIYARDYVGFSATVMACFTVVNDSDTMTDYFDKDRIRVVPRHPLHGAVLAALHAQTAHRSAMSAKRAARRG